jgi:preprotein translocase SecE subunit
VAKPTSRDKGSAAGMRDSTAREAADESPREERDQEMAEGMENDDMETGVDEAVVETTGSAVALSSPGAVVGGASRTAPARTGPPEFLMGNGFTRFLVESYLELRKVTWPRPIDAWNMTLIVIAMSVFVALLLGAADLGLAKALAWIVGLGAVGK